MGVKRHGGKWQVDLNSAYVGVFQDEKTATMVFEHGRYLLALGKPLKAVIRELRGAPEAPTLDQVYKEWYATLTVSDETKYRYKLRYEHMASIGKKPVNEVNAADIRRVVSLMTKKGASPKTVHVSAATLKQILTFAYDSEYIDRVPPFKNLPELVKKRKPRTVTPTEYRSIVTATPDRWQPFVAIMPLCGLRIGELLGLTWKHVNLDEGWIYVEQQVRRNEQARTKLKTRKSEGYVPLVPEAVEWLRIQKATCHPSDDGWVFAMPTGKVPSRTTIRRVFDGIRTKTKLEVTPHDMRHTAGSWLLDSGASLAVVSSFLRHASVSTTSGNYIHKIDGADAVAVSGLAKYLDGDQTGTA